jgi:hypothetical protein
MSEKIQLKGGICEFDFGYNAKMEGYTTLMSDIPKLYAIGFGKDEEQNYNVVRLKGDRND